jgi:hypothetical protein
VWLCRIHHRLVHRVGNEAAWWRDAGIDPIKAAAKLWTHGRLSDGRACHPSSRRKPSPPTPCRRLVWTKSKHRTPPACRPPDAVTLPVCRRYGGQHRACFARTCASRTSIDLRYIAADLGLRNVRIIGRNWSGYRSRFRAARLLTPPIDRILQCRPSLCSDIYLLGQKP